MVGWMPYRSQRSEMGVCSRRWSRRMAAFSWTGSRFRVFLDMGGPPLEVVAYSSRRLVPFQLKQNTIGFDSEGCRIWERWGPWRMDTWRNRPSWCDGNHGDSIALAFPGFVRRWRDPLWHHPIRLGTHWYVESHRGGGDIEGSIVL